MSTRALLGCLLVIGLAPTVGLARPSTDLSVFGVEQRSPCDLPEWWIEVSNDSSTTDYKVLVEYEIRASVGTPANCTLEDEVIREIDANGCNHVTAPFPMGVGCDCCSHSGGCACVVPDSFSGIGSCGTCPGDSGYPGGCTTCSDWEECPCSSFQVVKVTAIAERTGGGAWTDITPTVLCGGSQPVCKVYSKCDETAPTGVCQ